MLLIPFAFIIFQSNAKQKKITMEISILTADNWLVIVAPNINEA